MLLAGTSATLFQTLVNDVTKGSWCYQGCSLFVKKIVRGPEVYSFFCSYEIVQNGLRYRKVFLLCFECTKIYEQIFLRHNDRQYDGIKIF
jgi:hypothetical protein